MAKVPPKFSVVGNTLSKELGLIKLATSGLDEQDLIDLKFEFLEPHQTAALHPSFKAQCSIKIPYFDLDQETPLTSWPAHPPFYRLRYLDEPKDEAVKNFGDLTDVRAKPRRYVQEPNSGICAYFPPTADWVSISQDSTYPVIITEGEFKAAKASKEGFACIGLGGIYNFKSANRGVMFLKELTQFEWVKRTVYIIYDSDFKTNKNICRAMNELAEELMLRGAFPHCVFLPALDDGSKCGLDDFILANGPDSLWPLLERGQPLTLAGPLWAMNEKLTYIKNPGLIVDRHEGCKISPNSFTSHVYASEDYAERVVKDDGSISMERVTAAQAWIKWPMRSEASALVYRPGTHEFIEARGRVELNTWPGWGLQPTEGDISPFIELLTHLFTGAEDGDLEWFLRWCAYPLQKPGTKLFTSAVLFGIKHGTGKSLVGYTLGQIYGKNFAEITQQDLHGSFNEWAENKQFVLGDDVTGSNKREDADMLKKMITQKTIRINAKFMPSYVLDDCINYFFTSNQPDAFFLEDDDRRAFIHEVMVDKLSDEFYARYNSWMENGGAAHVFHRLLNLDLGDFNPAAPARRTVAKQRMTADVKSDLGSWVNNLLAFPDDVLKIGQTKMDGDLFTTRQLLTIYDPECKLKVTANGLGRELRRAGAFFVCEGKPVKTAEGQDRYYAIRNVDAWRHGVKQADVTAYLKQHEGPKSAKY